MKTINKNFKRGVAMIELIFAMVIMGIALLSAPLLIQQSTQSSSVTLQQEAIAATASHTSILLSKHWDEQNANYQQGTSPILRTGAVVGGGGAAAIPFNVGNPFGFTNAGMHGTRSGLANITGRLAQAPVAGALVASVISSDTNESLATNTFDDIDDYDNSNISLTVYAAQNTQATTGDYVDVNLNINTQVNYVLDVPPGGLQPTTQANNIRTASLTTANTTSNIKRLQVNLSSLNNTPELDKNITLSAFSCNIGTYVIKGAEY